MRSVKMSLKKNLGKSLLSYEELETVLLKIEIYLIKQIYFKASE